MAASAILYCGVSPSNSTVCRNFHTSMPRRVCPVLIMGVRTDICQNVFICLSLSRHRNILHSSAPLHVQHVPLRLYFLLSCLCSRFPTSLHVYMAQSRQLASIGVLLKTHVVHAKLWSGFNVHVSEASGQKYGKLKNNIIILPILGPFSVSRPTCDKIYLAPRLFIENVLQCIHD